MVVSGGILRLEGCVLHPRRPPIGFRDALQVLFLFFVKPKVLSKASRSPSEAHGGQM